MPVSKFRDIFSENESPVIKPAKQRHKLVHTHTGKGGDTGNTIYYDITYNTQ